jgi:hypothetical protein
MMRLGMLELTEAGKRRLGATINLIFPSEKVGSQEIPEVGCVASRINRSTKSRN